MRNYYECLIESTIERKTKSSGAVLEEKLKTKSDCSFPTFKMILTGFGPCYRRDDGIYVVPINLLKD